VIASSSWALPEKKTLLVKSYTSLAVPVCRVFLGSVKEEEAIHIHLYIDGRVPKKKLYSYTYIYTYTHVNIYTSIHIYI
jgi:hypothetical protein